MHRRNQFQARTERLPVELLAAVFHHLSEKDRITATHVCQSWRAAALNAPSLWTYVRSDEQRPGVLTARLSRIPPTAPLQLSLEIDGPRYNEVLASIRSRLPYMRSFVLLAHKSLDDVEFSLICVALSQPAPNLTRLSLMVGRREIPWSEFPLLAGDAPRPHTFKYFGRVDGLSAWPFLSNVRDAMFTHVGSTTDSSLAAIFGLCCNVERLCIELFDWTSPPADVAPITFPRMLRCLCIKPEAEMDLRDVLPLIPHGSLDTFVIQYNDTPAFDDRIQEDLVTSVAFAVGHPIISISYRALPVADDPSTTFIMMWTHDSTHLRELHRLRLSLQFIAESFKDLTRLGISGSLVPEDEGVYELPLVTDIAISFMEPLHATQLDDSGIFLLPRSSAVRFVCPAMNELVFAGDSDSKMFLAPGLSTLR